MPQKQPDLSSYSISSLLGMGVDEKDFALLFRFAALTQLLTLRVVGLVHMKCSRVWRDRFSDNSDILEVSNEWRKPTPDDLAGYAWVEPSPELMPELVVIKIEGGLNLTVICESFEVALEPLSEQYPYLV